MAASHGSARGGLGPLDEYPIHQVLQSLMQNLHYIHYHHH